MTRPARLGVVTGLPAEARAADALDATIRTAGASADRAATLAEALAEAGATGLVSFGAAGGLDPALAPGTIVIADRVVGPDGATVEGDTAWARRLDDALPPDLRHMIAPLAGSASPAADRAARESLFRRTNAVAVDMESHAVAAVAARRALPFIAVRAIADPAGRDLPPAALLGLDGGMRAVVGGLARRPRDLPGLIRLAGDYRAALRSLRRVTLLGAPRLGLV